LIEDFMSKRTAIGAGLAAAISMAMSALNGASADAIGGKELAEKWCAECHSLLPDQLSPNPAAPTFPKLAAEPSITQYSLRAFLRSPHESMPQITFTSEQMDDIVDYILSLKPHQ
jgi:mono/diheme cytochrome c family protein